LDIFPPFAVSALGCIAVTNSEMEELYQAVKIGTRIEIKP
jgi:lipoprotein-anchoring transpeptidase ErfK/SrfK